MNLKKRWSIFLPMFLLACIFLVGCHGKKEQLQFEIPQEFDESKQYEITFWAKNDTNIAQTRIYEKAIDDFMKIYPNININLRLYTDYGRIYNDVITNIATGTTPNVCITYPDHIATYMTGNNNVVPLGQLFEDEKYGLNGTDVKFESVGLEEIVPQFLDECYLNGNYYAIPYMRSTEACYVNKTYVEELGYELPEILTWDFVWEVSNAATKKNQNGIYDLNNQNVMIPFIYKSTDNMMIQMLKQREAGYSTQNGDVLIFNDSTKDILYTIADSAKKGAFSTFKISSYPANFLNAGQCVFAIDSTAGATWMGSYAPLSDISEDQYVEFETEVMMVPQYDVNHPRMISQGPSICVFNKSDSDEVLASWLFAQFLLTNDIQIAYAQTEGYLPVTLKAQNSQEYQEYLERAGEDNDIYYDVKIKASKLLQENMDNTFVTPVFNGSTSLRNAAGQMIENVTKSVRRKETIDEQYMESLFEDVTSLYRLDQTENGLSGKAKLGKLPTTAIALLSTLCIVWILMLLYVVIEKIRTRKNTVDL